jgi:hypothetical protein
MEIYKSFIFIELFIDLLILLESHELEPTCSLIKNFNLEFQLFHFLFQLFFLLTDNMVTLIIKIKNKFLTFFQQRLFFEFQILSFGFQPLLYNICPTQQPFPQLRHDLCLDLNGLQFGGHPIQTAHILQKRIQIIIFYKNPEPLIASLSESTYFFSKSCLYFSLALSCKVFSNLKLLCNWSSSSWFRSFKAHCSCCFICW